MEININNENREFIDAKKVNKHVQDFLAWLQSWLETTGTKLNEEYIPLAKKWVIIKAHKVANCDSNVAYKKMNKDGSFQIVITYLKDGDFLPANENVNIFINCDGLSKEMKEMFDDKDLIIVK